MISQNKTHQFIRPTVSHTHQPTTNNRVSINGKQAQANNRITIPAKNGVSCPNAFARAAVITHPTKTNKNYYSLVNSASNLTTDDLKGGGAGRVNQNYDCLDDNLFRATAQRLRSSAAVIAGGQNHRRNSLDTFSTGKLLAKTVTTAGASEPIVVERRRQSLIDADPPPVKQIRETSSQLDKRLHQDACSIRLVPSMSKHKLMSVLNARAKASVGPIKPARSNILCFKPSSPLTPPLNRSMERDDPPRPTEDSNFDSRLRLLDEKIRKHNQNVNHSDQQQQKTASTRHQQQALPLPSHSDTTVGSSLERQSHFARARSGNYVAKQHQHQQLPPQRPNRHNNRYQITDFGGGGDHAGQTRYAQKPHPPALLQQRLNMNGNTNGSNHSNYGVVRATDFFKLRSSEVTS